MKFEIVSQNFLKALSVIMRSVTSRAQLPVLANVLIIADKSGVELVSTDLEMSFRIKEGSRVSEEGRVTVPAKILFEFISTIKGGVLEVSLNGDSLEITGANLSSSFQTISAAEYPDIPRMEGEPDIRINASVFVDSLNKVAVCASKDDSRPVYTGILWRINGQEIELAATDGYRLSRSTIKASVVAGEYKPMVIPARALVELTRVIGKESKDEIEVKLQPEASQVIFRVGGVELISRLLGGDFPSFEQIIPRESLVSISVDKDEALEAIKRASIFARDNANIVRFDIGEGALKISARSPQMGRNESRVSCDGDTPVLATAFNFRYLIDCLGVLEDEEFRFESSGSLKPGVFKGKDESYLHIIMPVRLPEN